jgi:hypothetical protein
LGKVDRTFASSTHKARTWFLLPDTWLLFPLLFNTHAWNRSSPVEDSSISKAL